MAEGRLYRKYAANHVAHGPHDVSPYDDDAVQFLQDAEVGDGWLHPYSSNYTFVVELALESRKAFGVYKPRAGEAPLWDFPTGTLYKRECAAYELARLLGWGMVPPTVVREGEVGVGSLQLYVHPEPDSNYFSIRDACRDAVFRMAVFDIVANNADRKGGHCFIGQCGGVWGVDHGLTFNVDHKLRTVIWDFAGERVPRALLDDLCGLKDLMDSGDEARFQSLTDLLSPNELLALRQRLERLIAEPVLPSPHSRRDVPWPWL